MASLCPLFPPKFRVKEMIVHAYDDHLTRQALTVGQVSTLQLYHPRRRHAHPFLWPTAS